MRPIEPREAVMIGRRTLFCSAAQIGLALPGAGWTASARADSTYPGRPVRWVVPYTAGGATDVLSRLICQRLSERLGQPLIVENKKSTNGEQSPGGPSRTCTVIKVHRGNPRKIILWTKNYSSPRI
jgi:tripartite-type tricarboxylate transporter receptor subunit TctC